MRPWVRKRLGALAATASYLVLALAATWPLARSVRTTLVTSPLDVPTVALLNVWTLGWTVGRLEHAGAGYWDAPIFYPVPHAFALTEPQPLSGLVAWPLFRVTGSAITGTNLLLWLILTANGCAAYGVLRAVRLGRAAAFLGGAMSVTLPLVHNQLGVLQLTAVWGVLATLGAAYAWRKKGGAWYALAMSAAFAATYGMCVHHALMLSVLLVPAVGWLWIGRLKSWRAAVQLMTAAGLAGLFVAPWAIPQWRAVRQHGYEFPTEYVTALSARPQDYLRAPGGQLLQPLVSGWGHELSPGMLKTLLAVCGIVAGLRARARRRWTVLWLVVLLTALLFSFGPRLTLRGYSPYAMLVAVWPGFSQVRNVFRFAYFVQLAVVLLAARGWQSLGRQLVRRLRRVPPWLTRGAWAAVAIVAVAETWPQWPQTAAVPTVVPAWARWVAHQTARESVLAVVPFPADIFVADYEPTAQSMFWQLVFDRPLVNGYAGIFPESYLDLRQRMQSFPDAVSLEALRQFGVTHVVLLAPPAEPLAKWEQRIASRGRGLVAVLHDPESNAIVYAWAPAEP